MSTKTSPVSNTVENKYVKGSAKAVATKFGSILNLSLKLEDLQAIVNDAGYVNVTVFKRQETGKYGETHFVKTNLWSPESATHAEPF